MRALVCLAALVLAACGGAVDAHTAPPECTRVMSYVDALEAHGCEVPPDTAATAASLNPVQCIAFTTRIDACIGDRYCAEDMADRALEACHGAADAPQWSAP